MTRKRPLQLAQPAAVSLEYQNQLDAIITGQGLGDIAAILRQYRRLSVRQDAPLDPIRELIKRLREGAVSDASAIRTAAHTAASNTDLINQAQVLQQMAHGVGFDLGQALPLLAEETQKTIAVKLRKFIRENMKHYTRARKTFYRQISKTVTEHYRLGSDAGTLSEALLERLQVSRARAKLIARDQAGKYFGTLTRIRHEAVGVTKYMWMTAGDSRVRPEHEERDGRIYSYSDPPSDGNPGEPIGCRCVAGPIFED